MSDPQVTHSLSTITVEVSATWIARVYTQFLGTSIRKVDIEVAPPAQKQWASCPNIPNYMNIPDGKWEAYQISDGANATTSTITVRSNDTNCGIIPGEESEQCDNYVATGPIVSAGNNPSTFHFFSYKHLHSNKYHYTNIIIELVNDGGGNGN